MAIFSPTSSTAKGGEVVLSSAWNWPSSSQSAVFALPEIRQRMFELGYETVAGTPQEFAEFMRADTAQFAQLVAGAGIKVE